MLITTDYGRTSYFFQLLPYPLCAQILVYYNILFQLYRMFKCIEIKLAQEKMAKVTSVKLKVEGL